MTTKTVITILEKEQNILIGKIHSVKSEGQYYWSLQGELTQLNFCLGLLKMNSKDQSKVLQGAD